MAEAVLAGEEIKELARGEVAAALAALLAVFPRFPKHLLMRHSPRHAGDGDGQHE